MSEIEDGIHRIDTPLGERVNSLWLIRGSERSVLFDTGVNTTIPEHVVPYLADVGIDPATVGWAVISHADVDHFGGVADAHEQFAAASTTAHRRDADLIESYPRFEDERVRGFREPWGFDETPDTIQWCRSVARTYHVDLRVEGGEVLDLGGRQVELHASPGHTHGHLSLRDGTTGAWFISDAVLGATVPLADGTPAFAPTYRYIGEYLDTIDTIERADPPMLCTAHCGVFAGTDAGAFLRLSREFVATVEQTVLDVLGELGPSTLTDLLPPINQRVAGWPLEGTEPTLAYPVVGHLERLIERGAVRIVPNADGAARVSLTPTGR